MSTWQYLYYVVFWFNSMFYQRQMAGLRAHVESLTRQRKCSRGVGTRHATYHKNAQQRTQGRAWPGLVGHLFDGAMMM